MKKLLVIGYVWPEPNSSAAGARMLQLLDSFAQQGYAITYASPAQASPHAVDLAELNIDAVEIELNNQSFDEFIQTLEPNAVLFDRFMMEEQFAWRVEKHCPNALRILDTEDLHCLRYARQALAKKNPQQVIRDVPVTDLLSEHAIREVAAILRCDLSLMISEVEMDILMNTFNVPKRQLHYIPFMLKNFAVNDTPFAQRDHFVSIGNFRHEPNWDAVLNLKTQIWPLIRKQLPKAQLHVYGAYPPKKATQLHNEQQGFYVKGWVDDAHQMLCTAKVLQAPLRFGAGLKGKFIDAAQAGLPSVTTSIGSEGLPMDTPTLSVSDGITEQARMAVDLYQDENLWQNRHNNCSEFLQSGFAFDKYHTEFAHTLAKLTDTLAQHRQLNFTGTMLRHHSMKATQYMSQWIEAKNKLPTQ